VYRCSPHHPPHSVPVLATTSTTKCTGARRGIHHIVYRCSPRHPPQGVSVFATSSTTYCTGARRVIHHSVYRCSPRHPPHSVSMLATSSTTRCIDVRHIIHHILYRCSTCHPPKHRTGLDYMRVLALRLVCRATVLYTAPRLGSVVVNRIKCAVGWGGEQTRGLHSFPFPLRLSSLCPFPLNFSLLCPPYNPV